MKGRVSGKVVKAAEELEEKLASQNADVKERGGVASEAQNGQTSELKPDDKEPKREKGEVEPERNAATPLDDSADVAIRVRNLKKNFVISHSGVATFKQQILQVNKMMPLETLEVLRGISFDVHHSECMAVVGRNGAGKSTLLSLLSRIYKPTSGILEVHGRLAPLLELGAGFHPDLTGYENIFINGMILGISREELAERIDVIVDFAELRKHIDAPVRTYSSGMNARLGFAIAVHVDADVILLDEVLAVGDQEFKLKCGRKIDEMKKEGRTILLVSHSGPDVERLADRAIWLQRGLIEAEGDPSEVMREYNSRSENLLAPGAERLSKPGTSSVSAIQKVPGEAKIILSGKDAASNPVMFLDWTAAGVSRFFLSSTAASSGPTNRSNISVGAWHYPDSLGANIAIFGAITYGGVLGPATTTGYVSFSNAEKGAQSAGHYGTDFQVALCPEGASNLVPRLHVRATGDIHLNGSGEVLPSNATAGFTQLPQIEGSPTGKPSYRYPGNTPFVHDGENDLLWRFSSKWKPVQADTVETSTKTGGKVTLKKPYCLFTYGKDSSITLAIPPAAKWPGAWVKVKWTKKTAGNSITVAPVSGLVEGEPDYKLESNENSFPNLMLQSDGANWWKVSG